MAARIWLHVPSAERSAAIAADAAYDNEEMLWFALADGDAAKRCARWMWPDPMMAYWYGDRAIPSDDATATATIATSFMDYMKKTTTIIGGPIPTDTIDAPAYWLLVIGNDRGRAMCALCRKMRRSARRHAGEYCHSCTLAAYAGGPGGLPQSSVLVISELLARRSRAEFRNICRNIGIRGHTWWSRLTMAREIINTVGAHAARAYCA